VSEYAWNQLLSLGPDDGDWGDVVKRAIKAHHKRQIYLAAALLALIVAGMASAFTLIHRGQPWCKAPTSDAWKRVLASHVVELSRHVSVGPIAIPNAHSFYADISSKNYTGIVEIDARTSRYTRIHRDRYGVLGSTDGRWFAWADLVNGYGATRAIWAWDSRQDRLRRITRSMRSADGWWAGSWTPAVRHGYATWSQSASEGERAGVHVVNLSSGQDEVISSSGSMPFFLSDRVVAWTEDVRLPGTKNPIYVLRAADFVSGKRVPLPKALRRLRNLEAASLVTDGGALVYAAGPWRSLWWSPSLSTEPWRVFTLHEEWQHIGNPLQIAGRFVYFDTDVGPSHYLVDASDGGYVNLGMSALLSAKAMVLEAPSPIKSLYPITNVYFIPRKSFPPISACSGWRP
jgi:hypothetical protein